MSTSATVDQQELARFGPMIRSIARRMIRDPELARDAAQEAWVALVEGLETFRGECRSSTWVYTVASRAILRAARHERTYTTRFLSAYFHGPDRDERSLATPPEKMRKTTSSRHTQVPWDLP